MVIYTVPSSKPTRGKVVPPFSESSIQGSIEPSAPVHVLTVLTWDRPSGAALMLEKSGDHQLRLVVFPHHLQGFIHPRWLFGISEASIVWQLTGGDY